MYIFIYLFVFIYIYLDMLLLQTFRVLVQLGRTQKEQHGQHDERWREHRRTRDAEHVDA